MQIALGIVLGFSAIRYLRQIVAFGVIGIAFGVTAVLGFLGWTTIKNHLDIVGAIFIGVVVIAVLAGTVQYSARRLGHLYFTHRQWFVRSRRWRGLLLILGVDEQWISSAASYQEIVRRVGDKLFIGIFKLAFGYLVSCGVLIGIAASVQYSLAIHGSPAMGTAVLVATSAVPAFLIYSWIRWRRESSAMIFMNAAATLLDRMCIGDSAAAEWYRKHPEFKVDVEAIHMEIANLCADSENPGLSIKLRTRFAEVINLLVHSEWYVKHTAGDRDVIARYVFNSTLAEQDMVYQDGGARWFLYAAVLENIIFGGWDGNDSSKDQLRRLQSFYTDECRQHCEFVTKWARARNKAIPMTDDDKKHCKSILWMREALRRKLAGEKVFDDDTTTQEKTEQQNAVAEVDVAGTR